MKVKDIISVLEQWAPRRYQESYDNSGLIIGDPEVEVTGASISLDVTEEVIDEAIENNCNLIIAHHPLIFGGIKKIGNDHWLDRCIVKAIKNDINIYAIHTNLDNVHTGVNRMISDKIGLKNTKILAPKSETLTKLETFVPTSDKEKVLQALFDAGAGNIGEYSDCSFQLEGTGTFRPSDNTNPAIGKANELEQVEETKIEIIVTNPFLGSVLSALKTSHPYEEVAYYLTSLSNQNQEVGSGMVGQLDSPMNTDKFIEYLKKQMGLKVIKHTDLIKKKIKTVAVCGGAGVFLLDKAKAAGADIFITSDVKYHDFFEADSKIILADIGHYESEVFTKNLIHDYLSQKLPNIAFRLTGVDTNPVIFS